MIEPLFLPTIIAGDLQIRPTVRPREAFALEKYGLWRATSLAIESALRFGRDMPVGAVTIDGESVSSGFFASDMRTGYSFTHAEERAITYAGMYGLKPRLLCVNLEPCGGCQSAIASSPVEKVAFVFDREATSSRGLINSRPGLLEEIDQGKEVGFEPIQILDPALIKINGIVFDNVQRDRTTGTVEIDRERMRAELAVLPMIDIVPGLASLVYEAHPDQQQH